MISFKYTNLPELLEMDVVECSGAWNSSPRKAVMHLLEIIYKGSAVFKIDDKEYMLEEGDMIFIPQNEYWQSRTNGCSKCRFFYVFFMVDDKLTNMKIDDICSMISEANEIIHRNRYYSPVTPPASHFDQMIIPRTSRISEPVLQKVMLLISQMREERDNPSTVSGIKLAVCFSQILALITEMTVSRIQEENCIIHKPHLNPIVTQATRYMRLNFSKKITLSDLCHISNTSPQHLIRLFNNEFDQTPIQFLTNIRLAMAKEMVLNTDFALKEIAGIVGIDNPLYFSRIFRMNEGMPPREYRKKYRQAE